MKGIIKAVAWLTILTVAFYKAFGVIPAICCGLMTAGGILNLIVIAANGGRMPVLIQRNDIFFSQLSVISDHHCLLTRKTRLKFLADRFYIRKGIICSIGDIFFGIGQKLLWIALIPVFLNFFDKLLKTFYLFHHQLFG